MIRKFFLIISLAVLLIFSYTIVVLEVEKRRIIKMEALYDRGFDRIMASQPNGVKGKEDLTSKQLIYLKILKNKKTCWAEILGDQVYPKAKKSDRLAFMAIIPPEHSWTFEQKKIAEAKNHQEKNIVVRIKPVRITEEWAGIVLIGGLIRAFDGIVGLVSKEPKKEECLTEEVRIFRLQLAAVDGYTKGKFKKILAKIIADKKLTNPEELLSFYKLHQESFGGILDALDKTISANGCRSDEERLYRDNFYLLGLCFFILDKKGADEEEYEKVFEKVEESCGMVEFI